MSMIESYRTDPLDHPTARLPLTDSGQATDLIRAPNARLDGESARKRHAWLLGVIGYERRRQSPNRMQMALDHDYYDGLQLTDEDILELIDRGQAPLVYNLVKRTADWVIGTEKRTRFDYKVLARKRGQVNEARFKTDAMKYLDDVNKTPFWRSQAFREAVISGVGWLEDGVRGDADEIPIYSGNESWWYTLHDSHAHKLDNTDARYHTRWKYLDVDIAQAWFPDREQFILNDTRNGAVIDEKMMDEFFLGNRLSGEDYLAGSFSRHLNFSGAGGFVDSSRDRVKVYESWYKMPVFERTVKSKELPRFHGLRFDPSNEDMVHATMIGDATLVERVNMRCFYMIYTESGVLAAGQSPYRHNEFPFTPIWCYRRGRDNMPYGIIRNIRDPQDGFNRRMAKAIFALSAYRVTADADAIDPKKQSWEDVRIEAGRPDALLVKKKGTELKVEFDRQLGEEHLKIAQTEGSLILDASGVTADNLGMESNAQSGKAILAKQAEGSAVTAEVFDNLRLGGQVQGEKRLSLAEQFMTEETVLRVTDAKGRPNWKTINVVEQLPDGSIRVKNDMTATKADFVVDQQDFHATMRQAAVESLKEVLPNLSGLDPMLILRVLRMMIDVSDFPNKEEMVKDLDTITGYKDPDAALTEEEQEKVQQAEQEQAQAQQMQQEQQAKAFEAELRVKLADAEQKLAQAEKARADAEKTRAEAAANVGDPALAQQQNEALAEAQAHLAAAAQEKQALEQRLREVQADRESEKYRADREKEAKVEVARLSKPDPAPVPATEEQEILADLMQDVALVTKVLKDLPNLLKKDKEELTKVIGELRERVETEATENRAARDARGEREEKGRPFVIHNHIGAPSAGPKRAGKKPKPDNDDD